MTWISRVGSALSGNIEFEYETSIEPTSGKRQRRFRHSVPAGWAAIIALVVFPGSFAAASVALADTGPPPGVERPDDMGDENGRGVGRGTDQGGPDGQGTGRGNGSTTTTGPSSSTTTTNGGSGTTTPGGGGTSTTSTLSTPTSTVGGPSPSTTVPVVTTSTFVWPPIVTTTTVPCGCP